MEYHNCSLINDYGLEIPQPDYNVPDEYKEIVTLIRVNDELVNKKGTSKWTKSEEELRVGDGNPKLTSSIYNVCVE